MCVLDRDNAKKLVIYQLECHCCSCIIKLLLKYVLMQIEKNKVDSQDGDKGHKP